MKQKTVKQFSKEYVEYISGIAKKRSLSFEETENEYREFIRINYVFTGKGNIWRTFKKMPEPWEFYLATKTKKPDLQSFLELTAFENNESLSKINTDIELSIADAYNTHKDMEFWQQFEKQPTNQEFVAAFFKLMEKDEKDGKLK